jgi:hypothetical protein
MTRLSHCHAVIGAALLGLAAAAVQAQSLELVAGGNPLASGTFGANGNGGSYQISLTNVGTEPIFGPFTVSTQLPAGISLAAANGAGWSCAPAVAGRVDCTVAGSLVPFQPPLHPLTFWLDVAVGLAPPGGVATFVTTVASAQYPLPPVPTCVPNASTTGCVTYAASVQQSSLSFVLAGPDPSALPVGSVGSLRLHPYSQGFGINNSPVGIGFLLPPGLSFAGLGQSIPAWTCSAQSVGDGQQVDCVTPYLTQGQTGQLRPAILVDAGNPVGAVRTVVAWVWNPQQPAPTASECLAQPGRRGCAVIQVPMAPPVNATPVVNLLAFPQAPLVPYRASLLFARMANVGSTPPGHVHVHVRLPPGLAYLELTGAIGFIAGQCIQTPHPEGIDLLCSGIPAGLFQPGELQMRLLPLPALRRPEVPVVLALDFGVLANPQILAQCVADPGPAHCARVIVPVVEPCAAELGIDGVFCAGFQLPDTP